MRYSYGSSENTPIWVIIGINIVVFILEFIVPSLVDNLALQLGTFSQQPWTIVTSMFVHSPYDITHILFNMIALFFFGTFLVQLVGSSRFLIVYFIAGIVGNLVYLLFVYLRITPDFGVIGASGAIFGLGGVLVVLAPRLRVYIFGLIPVPLWIAVIGGFLIVFLPFFSGVAWQAHLGGLATGLLAGLYFRNEAKRYRIR
jgi:membrane associated rhomboid family serine protease